MANQSINIGSVPNDGTGDNLREGATKINQNFTEIYTALGDGTTLSVTETVQDAVGDAISAGIQTGITVTYNDTDNQINFDVTAGSVTRIDYTTPNLYSGSKADFGTGVKYILVKVWGAGGSGACAGSSVPGPELVAGGGGGGYNEKIFFLDELQDNFTITVGAGGARRTPGTFFNVSGEAGGSSTFTDGNITLEATGGGGGGTGITLSCKGGSGGRSGTFNIFNKGAYQLEPFDPLTRISSPNQFYLGGFGGGGNSALQVGPDNTSYAAQDRGTGGNSVYGGGGGGGTQFGGTDVVGGQGIGGNSVYGGGGGSGAGGNAIIPNPGGVSNFAGNGGSSTGISVPTDPTIQDGQFPAGGGAACQRSAAGNFSGAGANGRVTIYVFK
jgi:hypothetical protein